MKVYFKATLEMNRPLFEASPPWHSPQQPTPPQYQPGTPVIVIVASISIARILLKRLSYLRASIVSISVAPSTNQNKTKTTTMYVAVKAPPQLLH
jgi:hypothetical protein